MNKLEMSLALPVPDECRLLPSVSVDPSPADYQQLQELLHQALKREADALRKINHLHQQLMAAEAAGLRSDCKSIDTLFCYSYPSMLRYAAGSPRTDTSEVPVCHWEQLDNMHAELSQVTIKGGMGRDMIYQLTGLCCAQTSLGSPGTPPPALVVSGSPSISRAKSSKSISHSALPLEHDFMNV